MLKLIFDFFFGKAQVLGVFAFSKSYLSWSYIIPHQ